MKKKLLTFLLSVSLSSALFVPVTAEEFPISDDAFRDAGDDWADTEAWEADEEWNVTDDWDTTGEWDTDDDWDVSDEWAETDEWNSPDDWGTDDEWNTDDWSSEEELTNIEESDPAEDWTEEDTLPSDIGEAPQEADGTSKKDDEAEDLTHLIELAAQTYGNNISWDLSGGVLTLSGTGMLKKTSGEKPWASQSESITGLVIEEGITSIGESVFDELTALKTVQLPTSLDVIQRDVFDYCTELTSVSYSGTQEQWDRISIYWGNDPLLKKYPQVDRFADAEEISVGEERTVTVTVGGKFAYFKLVVPKGETKGAYKYTFSSTGNFDTEVFLYDASAPNETMANADDNGNDRNFCLIEDEIEGGKTYYFAVRIYGTKTGTFNVCLEKEELEASTPETGTGECGKKLTWTVENGVLTISGTGEMSSSSTLNWKETDGWLAYDEDIEEIVVEEGVTAINLEEVSLCWSAYKISLPSTLKKFRPCEDFCELKFDHTQYNSTKKDWAAISGSDVYEESLPFNATITYSDGSASTFATASCGEDATCTLKDGVLTISGTGSVTDSPWCGYDYHSVVIQEGITELSSAVFAYSDYLTEITIPASMEKIDGDAFAGCPVLTDVVFAGTKKQWGAVAVTTTGNEQLLSANVTFSACAYGHKLVEVKSRKATFDQDGRTAGSSCSVCGEVFATSKTIAKVSDVKLSYTSRNYNAKQQKPGVTVTDANGTILKADVDYTVAYGENKKVGPGTVTVILAGSNYSGAKELTFKIRPLPISGVATKQTNDGTVILTWNRPAGVARSKVYRAESPDGPWKLVKKIESATYNQYTTDKLVPGKTYYFRVMAYKEVNGVFYVAKNYSDVVTAIQTKPGKVKLSAPTCPKARTISLAWSAVNGASGYEIRRATSSGGAFTLVKRITNGTTLTYTNNTLTKGRTYYYKVRAYTLMDGKRVYGPYSSVKSCKITK